MEDQIRREMTPGVDDSPIIQFALDQLTRDVDVRGSRTYPRTSAAPSYTQPARTSRDWDMSQDLESSQGHGLAYPAAAAVAGAERSTRSGESSRYPQRQDTFSSDGFELPEARPIPGAGMSRISHDKEIRVSTPPQRHPLEDQPHSASSASFEPHDVFVPFEPSHPSEAYTSLTFIPGILRPLWLGLYIFACMLMAAGLIFSAVWSKKHNGLWDYKSFGDARYFVFEYLPQIFGMVLLLWLFQIQIALQRIAPFIAMASSSTPSRSQAAFLPLYPSHFLLPNVQYFDSRQFVIGAFMLVCWLTLFTIPLLAASFSARWFGEWRWVASQGVVWATLGLYVILILTVIVLLVYLRRQRTGLKWDPRSLADVFALLERANVMGDYADSETFASRRQFAQRLWSRTDRLGYWHTSRRPQDVFYGLGEEGGAIRRYSLEQGRIKEKQAAPVQRGRLASVDDLEAARGNEDITRMGLRDPDVLYRHVPWQLSTPARLAFMLVALVLLIAFFVITFLHDATVRGFFPKLEATSDANGFSPANFLYSFLPAALGLIAFLLWQPLDFTHRRLAPFAALSSSGGAHPAFSLLLDYPFQAPLMVTFNAIRNGDLVVAGTSIITLCNIAIPIVSGGVFWAQWYSSSEVRVAAHPAGLYALCVFLSIYALGYIFLFALGRPVALPHAATCLSEIISWVYMSPLLADRAFSRPADRAEMISRLCAPVLGSRAASSAGKSMSEEKRRLVDPERRYSSPPRLTVRLIGDDGYSEEVEQDQHHNIPVRPETSEEEEYFSARDNGSDSPDSPTPGARKARSQRSSISLPPPINATQPLSFVRTMSREVLGPRFGFGVFVGRDGREHLGIERAVRNGREMELVGDEYRGRRGSYMV